MRYHIKHLTRYEYAEPVVKCLNLAHVIPRNSHRQRCEQHRIQVNPTPQTRHERTDYFGNRFFYFSIERAHHALEVSSESWVDVKSDAALPSLDFGSTCIETQQRLLQSKHPDDLLAREFILDSPAIVLDADIRDYASTSFNRDRTVLAAVRDLTRRIYTDFKYSPGSTTTSTPLADVLRLGEGVCQDFAHLAIGCVRSMGFPARYVSGYLETLPPPGKEKLIGSDESHAWFAVYIPGEGWHEFDPTNDTMAREQHITTAWGRDYTDVAPLRGVIYGGGDHQQLTVSVDVTRTDA